jgi:hypothetical protein
MPRRIAVCVGQNTYSPTSGVQPPLKGCINDAMLIGSMLSRAGFEVRQLHDQAATQRAILTELETGVAQLREGDYFVFWNASHGYRVRDRSGDELFDFVDEAISTYDNDYRNPLTDDKFQQILGRANPGSTILFGSDSCFSATLTRQLLRGISRGVDEMPATTELVRYQYQQRIERLIELQPPDDAVGDDGPVQDGPVPSSQPRFWIPPEDALDPAVTFVDLNRYVDGAGDSAATTRGDSVLPVRRLGRLSRDPAESQMRHLFLSGCGAQETAADAPLPQGWHGAMTYYFATAVLQAWAAGRPITYQDAHAATQTSLDGAQYFQHPSLEGPEHLKDAYVFGYVPTRTSRPATVNRAAGAQRMPSAQSKAAQEHVRRIHAQMQNDPWLRTRLRIDPRQMLMAQGVPSELVDEILPVL